MKSLEHQCLDFWRSKPADKWYDWTEKSRCALGQFAEAIGVTAEAVAFVDSAYTVTFWPASMLEAAVYKRNDGGTTFGAAADRLEALLAEQSDA